LDCSSEFTDGNDSSLLDDNGLSLLLDSLLLDLLLNSGESFDVSHLSDHGDSASLDDLHDGWAHDSSVDNDWSLDDSDAWSWGSSWLSDSSDLLDESLGLSGLDSDGSHDSSDGRSGSNDSSDVSSSDSDSDDGWSDNLSDDFSSLGDLDLLSSSDSPGGLALSDDGSDDWSSDDDDSWSGDSLDSQDLSSSLGSLSSDHVHDSSVSGHGSVLSNNPLSTDELSDDSWSEEASSSDEWSSEHSDGVSLDRLDSSDDSQSSHLSVT